MCHVPHAGAEVTDAIAGEIIATLATGQSASTIKIERSRNMLNLQILCGVFSHLFWQHSCAVHAHEWMRICALMAVPPMASIYIHNIRIHEQ